jgi:tRNA (guanine-N7-)-methyltransferase
MPRNKLKHFAEMKTWGHVLEPERGGPLLPYVWEQPLMVELGCGQGAYTVALGAYFPKAMVVGVDIKGSRMWHGAKQAHEQNLSKVRFLRTRVEDLAHYFPSASVADLWITFPDPHLREGKAKKRLTSPRFLSLYKELLAPNGSLHLKTDCLPLFEYSLETLAQEGWHIEEILRDVHADLQNPPLLREVRTAYENKYLKQGKAIFYLKASPNRV